MAIGQHGAVLRHIHRIFGAGTVSGMSEGELLERFVSCRDEAAFEALVVRHGPMVLGVCRQVLRDPDAAEDAFQATFLILVRKAGTLRRRELLGNWLYGVAYRVALRARAEGARRRQRERPGGEERAVEPARETMPDDLRPVIHEEVHRLPEKYRIPVVLCYLEGQTHEEAAEHLQWPIGTVKGRLARARDLLRSRLTRRGLALPAGAVAAELARGASAAIPTALLDSTIKAALLVAAGQAATAGVVSATVAALSEGMLRTMFMTKLKIGAMALLVVGVAATGAGVLAQQGEARKGKTTGATAKAITPNSPEAVDAASPQALAEDRLAAARKTFEDVLSSFDGGQIRHDSVYLWSRRWMEAERALNDKTADQVAAAEGHRNRMKSLEQQLKDWSLAGVSRKVDLSAGQYYLREAELWLAEAKAGRMIAPTGGAAFGMSGMIGSQGPGAGGMGLLEGGGFGGVGSTGPTVKAGGMVGGGGTIGGMSGGAMAGEMGGMGGGVAGMGGGMGGMMRGGGMGGMGGGMERGMGRGFGGFGSPFKRRTLEDARKEPANAKILEMLERPIPFQFPDDTPLEDVLKYIKAATVQEPGLPGGLPIYLNPRGFNGLGLSSEGMKSPIRIDLEGIPLKTTLRLLLKQVDMGYVVKEGLVIIDALRSDEFLENDDPTQDAQGNTQPDGAPPVVPGGSEALGLTTGKTGETSR
jgi:RNA polymerase sigma factor (sigma-70 family)